MTDSQKAIRRQFPAISNSEAYLDSAATTHKPQSVIDAMSVWYETHNGNVHRGVHSKTDQATNDYEAARTAVARFIGAEKPESIIFTKNATEGVNLAAHSLEHLFTEKDTIILSVLEHHSNILPWMQLSERTGAQVTWTEHENDGRLNMDSLQSILESQQVRLIAITGQSNVLGIKPDLSAITTLAQKHDALTLIDATQLCVHDDINVTTLDVDMLVCSGHKLYGPTGIGVLYAHPRIQKQMKPFITGGGTVQAVSADKIMWADAPHRFEGGTPPIAEAVGLHAALKWLTKQRSNAKTDEEVVYQYTWEQLQTIPGIQLLGPGPAADCSSIISFTHETIHPHDLTDILSSNGIHLRAGHHCAQPIHAHLGIQSSARASIGIYTTKEEIDTLIHGIHDAIATFQS